MPEASRLDQIYAKLLSDHPYGWALYKKVTTRDIRPGVCGYFDSDGDWRTIVDLSNPGDLTRHGWTLPDDSINDTSPPGTTIWGPKSSKSVRTRSLGATAKADAAASPLETSITVSFESKSDQGAVLTTANPVTRTKLGNESSALQWMTDNTLKMMHRHKDIVKSHGIWIITKSYSTRSCAIAIMTSQSSSIDITLDSLNGFLILAPNSAFFRSTGSSCTETHEDEDGVVVFISGMYLTQKPWRSKMKSFTGHNEQKDKIFRGDDGVEDDESNDLDVTYYPPYDEDDEESGEEDEFV